MDEKNKSFEKFIEEEMAKSPEQIQKEIMEDPDYPKLTPRPESYEKLKKRIQKYELEKVKKAEAEKALVAQLSKEDQEALRLGRELQERRKAEEKEDIGKVIMYRKQKIHKIQKKAVLAASVAIVMTMGMSITSLGGPKQALVTMTQMFGERSRTTVNSDTGEDTLEVKVDEEEKAYQEIKEELGFDPVRMGYLPEKVTFQKIEFDKESQDAYFFYESNQGDIVYMMQKQYTNGKNTFDVEDTLVREYQVNVGTKKIKIVEYHIEDLDVNKYSAEFTHKGTWYRLSGVIKKEEIKKIVENLNFF